MSTKPGHPFFAPGGLAFANGLFLIGGDGQIATSPDGAFWSVSQTGTSASVTAISHGAGQFVAVGSGGLVLTSPDGVRWEKRASGTTRKISGVTYGDGLFVAAVGDGNSAAGLILTSPDGISWSTALTLDRAVLGVAYGNDIFVAVGAGGVDSGATKILTSADGVAWTAQDIAPAVGSTIAFGNGKFVIAGYSGNNSALTSSDGLIWKRVAGPGAILALGFGKGLFIATTPAPITAIMSSADGVKWQAHASGAGNLSGVAYGNDRFIAIGSSGVVRSSTNGTSWAEGSLPPVRRIQYGNGVFVAVGGAVILFSDDGHGAVWQHQTTVNSAFRPDSLNAVTHGGGKFVIVGGKSTELRPGEALWSTNGQAWNWGSQVTAPLSGVTYGNGLYVAAGGVMAIGSGIGANIHISTNASTWKLQYEGGQFLYDVAYGNGRFVAVGSPHLVSNDGLAWTEHKAPARFTSITFGNGRFVAGGEGVSASVDGLIWSEPQTDVRGKVSFGNGIFLAVESTNLWTSLDGLTWARRPLPNVSFSDVTFGNGAFVAAGAAIWRSGRMPEFVAEQVARLPDGGTRLVLSADAGDNFEVQASGDLRNWRSIKTITNSHSNFEVIDAASSAGHQFYRIAPVSQ